MQFEVLVPVTLFICIAYTIKAIVDGRVHRQMVSSNGSEELVRSILQADELRRRQGSLRWGITLIAVALGFALIEAMGWRDVTPGVIAVLAGATGLGNLAFHFVSTKQASSAVPTRSNA